MAEQTDIERVQKAEERGAEKDRKAEQKEGEIERIQRGEKATEVAACAANWEHRECKVKAVKALKLGINDHSRLGAPEIEDF